MYLIPKILRDAFRGDIQAFGLKQVRSNGISEGDGIFVLGFPLGEVGKERNYVIARHGIIARVQDWFTGNAHTFLIDASIFPGSSGSPVLLKPELSAIKGTKSHRGCVLIGMISSYIPYRKVSTDGKTGRNKMMSEENADLGIVIPVDMIQETIDIIVKSA